MLKKTELREAAYDWILRLTSGKRFMYSDVYRFLETDFPAECSARGNEPNEPRYRHDARFAVWDARLHGVIRHTGRRGERQRC